MELQLLAGGGGVTATGQMVSLLQGTQKRHAKQARLLFFFLFKEKKKKKSNITNEKKDILTCTLQSWYLLDVPVQVLLASPLTDFLLNKETTVRQGSETLLFTLLKEFVPCFL